MPKSRGRRKKKKSRHSKRQSGVVFSQLPQLSSDEHAAFKAAAIDYAKAQPRVFQDTAAEIEEILREVDPLQILAVTACYGLQGFVSDDGVVQPGPFAKNSFSQHHLELCQAIALRLAPEQTGKNHIAAQALEPLVQALGNMANAFSMQRLVQLENPKSDEDHLLLQIQESLRLHTQFVRNWGSFAQVVDHSKRLYSGLDDVFQTALGVSATDLIELFYSFIKLLEDKHSTRIDMLAKVFDKRLDRDQMIAKYFELNPHLSGSADEFTEQLPDGVSRDNIVALIFNHSDLLLRDLYTFTSNDAANLAGAKANAWKNILDLLSCAQGDFADRKLDHLLLDNPVWTRPLIRLGEGCYFIAIPQAFFSHIHRIMAHLASEIAAKKTLENCRADFLEAELERLLLRALPHARIEKNIKWLSGSGQYETDMIAIIDRTMIIAEAKSGAISDPALRGAPDRAKRHVRELVFEPSIQSERFQNFVESAQQGDENAQHALKKKNLWPLDIQRFVRLAITLEDFSVIASSEKELKSVGWVDEKHELAPNMTAADFEIVCNILDDEAILVHYLSERGRLQKRFKTLADELDWLGFYLETGFAFAATEKTDLESLSLSGLSKSIDDYVNAFELGLELKKPTFRRSKLWTQTLGKIGSRRMPGWIEASIALLRAASVEEQRKVHRHLRRVIKKTPREWSKPNRKTAVFIVPSYDNAIPVILFAHPNISLGEQRAEAQAFAQQCFQDPEISMCLVIGFNAKIPDAPFDYLTFVKRDAL